MKKTIYICTLTLSLGVNLFLGYKFRGEIIKEVKQEIVDFKSNPEEKKIRYELPPQKSVFGIYHNEEGFNRIENKYQNIVRNPVWSLSKHSSGLSVRFKTDSPFIWVKWKNKQNRKMSNMNNIGANGLDIYVLNDSIWQFIDSAIPESTNNEYLIAKNMDKTMKDFQINLPLYSDVEKLEIGVDSTSEILWDNRNENPIVFYGTSITQGASASRPGMAYPTIVSRIVNKETINLGFSGNGKFEIEVAEILCEINAEIYVIDCTPNSPPELIKKNALDFIKKIKECNPNTPILLMESIIREEAYFNNADENTFGGLAFIESQNTELRKIFEEATSMGINNIYYLEGKNLIGVDHDATVDGTHLSDLGMYRIAHVVSNKIEEILIRKK